MRHLDDYETIARELDYPDQVIKELRKAKSDRERDKIMVDARKNAKDYIYLREVKDGQKQ